MRYDNEQCRDVTPHNWINIPEIPMAVLPDVSSPMMQMMPSAIGMAEGRFKRLRRDLGESILSHSETTALASCQRDAQHAQNIGHLVLVSRYFGGSSKGYSDNRLIDRTPGSIYILDGALTWEGLREAGTLQTVYLPKELIEFDPNAHPGFKMLDLATPVGQSVNFSMDQLFHGQFSRSDADLNTSLEQLLAWIKVAFGANPKRGDIRRHAREAMFRKICDHIEFNLHSNDLTMNSVLESFGVSRATLYRMFEPHGGVRNYITERRALRAAFDLSSATGQRGQVRMIGEKWGFPTPVEFNRTIRRLYDRSPGTLFPPAKTEATKVAA